MVGFRTVRDQQLTTTRDRTLVRLELGKEHTPGFNHIDRLKSVMTNL